MVSNEPLVFCSQGFEATVMTTSPWRPSRVGWQCHSFVFSRIHFRVGFLRGDPLHFNDLPKGPFPRKAG